MGCDPTDPHNAPQKYEYKYHGKQGTNAERNKGIFQGTTGTNAERNKGTKEDES